MLSRRLRIQAGALLLDHEREPSCGRVGARGARVCGRAAAACPRRNLAHGESFSWCVGASMHKGKFIRGTSSFRVRLVPGRPRRAAIDISGARFGLARIKITPTGAYENGVRTRAPRLVGVLGVRAS